MNTKLSLALLAIIMTCVGGCSKDEDVIIPPKNFADRNFREFLLLNYDTDFNGQISEKEAEAVKEIDCSSKNIQSMKGIEYFTSLEKLICNDNLFGSLDCSNNPQLKMLNCRKNHNLKTLNISQCAKLEVLYCDSTQITS